jgi:hypothetical protein
LILESGILINHLPRILGVNKVSDLDIEMLRERIVLEQISSANEKPAIKKDWIFWAIVSTLPIWIVIGYRIGRLIFQ